MFLRRTSNPSVRPAGTLGAAALAIGVCLAPLVLTTGCHKRCEKGFIREGGVCVAFGIGADAGPRLDGASLPPDSGSDPVLDAGTPVADTGPRPDSGGQTNPGSEGRILVRGAAVLPMVDGRVHRPGEVYIEDGRIRCVGEVGACEAVATEATVVETNGIVLPGLVDAHNHVAYDWLSEWEAGRLFDDSGQWRASSGYDTFVAPYSDNKADAARFCAMVRWGEMLALANGVTTVFGAPQPRTCFRWLVRNAELSTGYNGFAADRMRTNTLGIDTVDMTDAANLIEAMDAGEVTAYVIHLAEGLSARARSEYLDIQSLGLLRAETVLIHATALEPNDFAEVAAAGASVVWSPSSNMVLYGDTTNVQAALNAGVSVSIAPDWTPSGSDAILDEVRYAQNLVEGRWPGLLTAEDYVAMVTSIPARQLGLAREVGTLQEGLHGDLLVVDGSSMTPFQSVIEARPQDIRLVMIGGVPSYGGPDLMQAIPDTPADCHDVDACGTLRRACWEDSPDGPVRLTEVAAAIQEFYPSGPEPLVDCD